MNQFAFVEINVIDTYTIRISLHLSTYLQSRVYIFLPSSLQNVAIIEVSGLVFTIDSYILLYRRPTCCYNARKCSYYT